jgi:uncharacterized protein YecE (DUF72 family)
MARSKTKGKKIYIGTSGWSYDHWKGRFYPEDLKKKDWLSFYSEHYDTVELNNTFYHLPKESTFEKWARQSPDDFVFCVKASRYITHVKKLNEPKDSVGKFMSRAQKLGDKLGPVLYQIPPNLHKNAERLEEFLKVLPQGVENFVEFRHKSWLCDEIYKLLDEYNVGFCIHDLADGWCEKVITGKKIYLRFHGASGKYEGSYSDEQLEEWAKWIKKQESKVDHIYAYFNNDVNAQAIKNSRSLSEFVFGQVK